MRRISSSLAHLTWITSGTGWLSIIVPILVAAPAYFGGDLSLGGLIMVAGAFTQVQGAMRWFVDNFSRIADWRAAVHRVARFREALDKSPPRSRKAQRKSNASAPGRTSGFRGRAHTLAGRTHRYRGRDRQHRTGRAGAVIVGETGRGKSTLFRAVAGSLAVGFWDHPDAPYAQKQWHSYRSDPLSVRWARCETR